MYLWIIQNLTHKLEYFNLHIVRVVRSGMAGNQFLHPVLGLSSEFKTKDVVKTWRLRSCFLQALYLGFLDITTPRIDASELTALHNWPLRTAIRSGSACELD